VLVAGAACAVALVVVARDGRRVAVVGLVAVMAIVAYRGRVAPAVPDLDWLPLLFAAALATRLVSERLELQRERALDAHPPSSRSTRGLVGTAALLFAVALLATALGAHVDLPPDVGQRDETQPLGGGTDEGSTGAQPDPGAVGKSLGPYLGFDDALDSSLRGELGDEVVLHVTAPAPDFWRGTSFDQWNGRTWTRSRNQSSASFGAPFAGNVEFETFRQRVRVEASAIGSLFGAYRPMYTDLPPGTYRYGTDGLELRQPLGRDAEYTLESVRALATPEMLRTHDPRAAGVDVPKSGTDRGRGASPRAIRLAARVTADAPTTYDAIRALERWLRRHTTYTLDIPPLPDGADAVDQFLFIDRKGFCVQIASSMTVMLRSIGVPARVGAGFTPGEESLLGGDFTVRARDAHAWVEVWFPGVGWQAFDPTAEVPLAGEYDDSLLARLGRIAERLAVVLVVIVAVAIAVAAWLARRAARRRRRRPWATGIYRRLEREGRKRGRPRRPDETPRQYADALSRSVLPHPDQLDVVARAITAAAYAPDGPDPAERADAEAALVGALEATPRRRR
jgi:transglutaminase-like putative cysteine protease